MNINNFVFLIVLISSIIQLLYFKIYYRLSNYQYISKVNTLCYSFIPNNIYINSDILCKINCSYERKKYFPLNSPLKCKKNKKPQDNIIYSIYYFNTSTYGYFAKEYRYFYGYSSVYIFL